MKKIFSILIVLSIIIPQKLKSQDEAKIAALAAGVIAMGTGFAAVEQLKEKMELKAVEHILSAYPDIKNFELKTSILKGASIKDISSAGIVTYEMNNYDKGERVVLFLFLSTGWTNQYGIDFNKVKWKLFDRKQWNNLMQAFVETASRKEVSLKIIGNSDISSRGLKNGKDYILEFDKMRGDVYYTLDYSDEFKVVFNEGKMGLYIKETRDLVQIKKKAITRAHSYLNFK